MRKTIALILLVSLIVFPIPAVRSDDSDIFIGANIEPNVMILIDSSQSMSDSITSNPYDPATTYAVVNKCGSQRNSACVSTVVYRRVSTNPNTYTLYKNTVADVPSSSARTALNTVGYWSGSISGTYYYLFLGNYLNYQLGVCAVSPCSEPKITIAKRVIENLISSTEGVRFGTMKFTSGGGLVISPIGTPVGTITTPGTLLYGVHNMTQTSVGTVLGEQIRDAGTYYKGQFGYASPIQYSCQANFAIVVSDGLYTGIDPRPQATTLYTTDHATGLAGTQNVIIHTIGFGIGVSEPSQELAANDVLRQVAANAGGSFYKTDTAAQLEAALQDAIRQIVAATFTFATPVIPTTSATGSSRLYLAAFQSDPSRPFWRGLLKAYQRGSNGLVPVDANGVPLDSALIWEAGAQLNLKSPADRTIYALVSGSLQAFTKTNSAITASLLGVSTSADRDKIIDFIRGVDAYDEDGDSNVTEDRAWKLGDIFHSTPVLVTPPFLPSTDASYVSFRQASATRTTVLIAGANDGMLHAFRESNGEELWSFIPDNVLNRLKDLAVPSNDHSFYVDSSPIAADIMIGSNWKTILVFGQRRGGRSYYALDITDTTNPSYLWSFTDSKMGETWSEPAIGKVKMSDGTTKFVAFVGGGYDTAVNNSSGKAVFAIDLATGAKLWEYYNATGSTDDRQYMNFSLAANPTAVDLDNNGFIDRVYIGDVAGQLWKFDTSALATLSGGLVTNWTGKRLFTAPLSGTNPPAAGEYYPTQAIYGSPIPAFDNEGNVWVYFGTGDRNHPNSTSTNRFYGIKDNTSMTNGTPLTESSLVNVTSTDITGAQGWYFLLASTEKVLAPADVFNYIVYFTSFTPTTVVACDTGGGTARLYGVQMLTGYAAVDWAYGTALTTTDSSQTRYTTSGTGIPTGVITTTTESGVSVATYGGVGTTNGQVLYNALPSPPNLRRVLYWREVF